MNWSGGKDSALCLFRAQLSNQYNITQLLTTVNTVHDRISMHGVRRTLLEAQARSLGIPLKTIELPEQPGMAEYEKCMTEAVQQLKNDGCTHSVFGDIFLEDLKAYREKKLAELDIRCVFPLWKINTRELIKEFVESGFKSIIVCVNEKYLDKSFCGRMIDHSFIQDLPDNVDPCGENGEYHSFVFEGPIFKDKIEFSKGEIVYRKYDAPRSNDTCHTTITPDQYGFYFCDLL
ncbi:MAG: diphthine--ammonia ligase [Chitinophagaceae bacterium]|nr:diphthine--ammonia ligase [Chitinophagaceae bacterium]